MPFIRNEIKRGRLLMSDEVINEFENDSLIVTENEDGTIRIEWDSQDPKYSFLNGLTEEQVTAILEQILMEYTQKHDESLLGSDE
jgi:hypothetical protein